MWAALDNFGTGYSSLSYLERHLVDAIKIDRSFVRQIGTVGGDPTVVTVIIDMARNLCLRVIAEGDGLPRRQDHPRVSQADESPSRCATWLTCDETRTATHLGDRPRDSTFQLPVDNLSGHRRFSVIAYCAAVVAAGAAVAAALAGVAVVVTGD